MATERPARDIILFGGSAGAIEALQQILRTLPRRFAASLFVVIHTSADGPGMLPRVLSRAGFLKAVHPADGDRIIPGYVYVAPPDRHLILRSNDTLHVFRGPRENGTRPAVDPLFRSAAAAYGPRAIAVVLSGFLDDGAAGLFAIRKRGGLAIVQDPNDALAGDMPQRALSYAGADHVLRASEIGAKLAGLAGEGSKVVTMKRQTRMRAARAGKGNGDETQKTPNAFTAYPEESGEGSPSAFACPECHGVLWEIKEGGGVRYRCRTGHAYAEATLNQELSRAAEAALWAAMRALEEKASMARRMADAATGTPSWRTRLQEQAATFATHAQMIRNMIFGEPPMLEGGAEDAAIEGGQTG